jgi:uncharacterized protein YdaU (DUF1376 family)
MTQAPSLDTQIINGLQSHLSIFKYSDRELEALALGMLEGIKLAGAQAPLLEFAYLSNQVQQFIAGECWQNIKQSMEKVKHMEQVTKKKNDRMAWFKFDVGSFISDTTGLSTRHAGIYIRLLSVYWTSVCTLPEDEVKLKRRLGLSGQEDEDAMAEILDEFFPYDENGRRYHAELDRQLSETVNYSRQQSERGKLRHNTQKSTVSMGVDADTSSPAHTYAAEDF